MRVTALLLVAMSCFVCAAIWPVPASRLPITIAYAAAPPGGNLDSDLEAALAAAGFTGTIEQTFHTRLEANLGRPINAKLANLGRMLWFDTLHSLHQDNTCGGCHSPSNGFGDSQPMAIGGQNNGSVGRDRIWSTESAPLAARDQHGALSGLDVERALQFVVRRPVRQLPRLPVSVS